MSRRPACNLFPSCILRFSSLSLMSYEKSAGNVVKPWPPAEWKDRLTTIFSRSIKRIVRAGRVCSSGSFQSVFTTPNQSNRGHCHHVPFVSRKRSVYPEEIARSDDDDDGIFTHLSESRVNALLGNLQHFKVEDLRSVQIDFFFFQETCLLHCSGNENPCLICKQRRRRVNFRILNIRITDD